MSGAQGRREVEQQGSLQHNTAPDTQGAVTVVTEFSITIGDSEPLFNW